MGHPVSLLSSFSSGRSEWLITLVHHSRPSASSPAVVAVAAAAAAERDDEDDEDDDDDEEEGDDDVGHHGRAVRLGVRPLGRLRRRASVSANRIVQNTGEAEGQLISIPLLSLSLSLSR